MNKNLLSEADQFELSEDFVRAACRSFLPLSDVVQPQSRRLEDIFKEIDVLARLPLEKAQALPASAYTSPEFFAWENQNIFRKEWMCVAHVSQIPEAGDFITLDLINEPLIVVRGKEGEVCVLSRVCPHRGMDIMPPGFGRERMNCATRREGANCGHTRLFLCPYHAWTFELDGRLKACPEMHLAEGFSRDDWALRTFRSEVWHGFVFVNLDGQAEVTLKERLQDLDQYISQWKPESCRIVIERTWDCPFDWKVLVENFMESYHHAGAHRKTLQLLMPAKDTWTEKERPYYIRCHLPYKEAVRESIRKAKMAGSHFGPLPEVPGLGEQELAEWGLILFYPHFLLATAPDSLVWYRLSPVGPGRIQLLTTLLVPEATWSRPEFVDWLPSAEKASIGFHLEDMECCSAVQRGYYSLSYQQGRLSHLEMPIWLFQRYLAARSRGTWPTLDYPGAASQR